MESHAIAVGEGELEGDYSGDDFGRAFNFVAGCSSTPHVGPTIDTGRNTTARAGDAGGRDSNTGTDPATMLCLWCRPVSHIEGTLDAQAAAPGGVSVALNAIARRGWAHRLRASAARAASRLLFIRPPPVGIRSSCEWRGAGADPFRRRARSVWLEMRGCGALLNILPVRVVRHGVDLAAGRREFDHAGHH